MKKFILPALVLSCMLASAPCLVQPAHAEEETVRIFNTKSDWSVIESTSKFEMSDGELEIIPTTSDTGATYTAHSYKNAVIEFEYQMSYDEGVDPYNEADGDLMPGSFLSIIFGNNVKVDGKWTGNSTMPWIGKGGYPYMLSFDTERQLTDKQSPRYDQVGLSLRRYKYGGGHSYAARWSTVAPGDFTYLCSDGEYAQSLMPEFSKPVKVTDCFDTDAHTVKIDYRAEYVSQGAEKDVMKINVWFDEELVLTVADEMPFKGESWGTEIDVDKRDTEGYIGIYAHHASVDNAVIYDWKVNIKNMKVTDLGTVNKNGSGEKKGKGCSGSAAGVLAVAAIVPVIVTLVLRKKEKEA